MNDTRHFESAFGNFTLQRYPLVNNQPGLQAWNAADELLLQHVHEHTQRASLNSDDTPSKPITLLILNDQFGALATHLNELQPHVSSDSYLGQRATEINLALNQIAPEQVTIIDSLTTPSIRFDWVVIKVPKTLALLEDQLYRLRHCITANTKIVGSAMVKDIHSSTLNLFESILGKTTTSLAKKKARLIFCEPSQPLIDSDKPSPYPSRYTLENTDWTVCNHANVFSRQKLDIGTRLFLQQIEALPKAEHIIDLGCGNGILGCLAGNSQANAAITFTDESFMAIASAKHNSASILSENQTTHFCVDDSLTSQADNCADLILNNPPFHQQSVIGDHIAWQMFKDAQRVLKPNGELWVIGNRHLNYHAKLKKLFGNCRTIATNNKFILMAAVKNET